MKMSVVIPTWNEEFWLPRLLDILISIPDVDEIIVADNESSDATVAVARDHECRVIRGGRPARARNFGARAAQSDVVVFIDADVVISSDTVSRLQYYFESDQTVAVHFSTYPITESKFCKFCYRVMNHYFGFLSRVGLSQGVGSFLAFRKVAFDQVNGFDEAIEVGEDADMYRRLGKVGRVIFDDTMNVYVSARRFSVENPFVFAAKCVMWAVFRLFGTRISLVSYKWIPHPSSQST